MDYLNQEYKSLRLPAWQLALSLLPYIVVIAVGIIGFSGALPPGMTFKEITPQIMKAIRLPWAFLNIFIMIATLNIAFAAIMIASATKMTRAHVWMIITIWANVFTIILSIISTMMRIIVINFIEPILGANSVYTFSSTLVTILYPLTFFAIFSLCAGLAVSDILRKTGLIVGAISGLLCVLSFFPDISNSMPPFLLALLMMPVGIGLLRKERQAASKLEVALQGT
jgi:hypothetical protein